MTAYKQTSKNKPKHPEVFRMATHATLEGTDFSRNQSDHVVAMFMRHNQVFSRNSNDLGFCDKIKHKIILEKDAKPFRRAYASMSFEKRKAIKKIVEDLEKANLVEPIHSWAAPSKLVKQKDGIFRLVVDYRGLNKQNEKTSWPLPRINDVIDSLDRNIYFSNIDLTSGYFQMTLEEESQNLTAFITPIGLYKWKRLPMGLTSAQGVFQNLMELILAALSYEVALIYLDDIIIFGKSFQEHLSRLELVLCRIKEAGLKIKGSKCRVFQKSIHFLGHIISKDGVEVDPDKVSAVANMKPPSNLKELRAILGLVGFYWRFIADFGKTAEPLYRLLSKTEKFVWTTDCGESMNQLELKLQEAPILGFPNDTDPYTLTTDASLTGIGAIIIQKQNWGDRVIAYASKTLNKGQRNYSAKERIICYCLFHSLLSKLLTGKNIYHRKRSSRSYVVLQLQGSRRNAGQLD